MTTTRYSFFALLLACLGLLVGPAARAQAPAWQSVTSIAIPSGSNATTTATVSGNAGEVYAVGYFSGTITFGTTTLTSAGADDIFVARWNEGTHTWAWAQRAGGAGNDRATAVATGSGGLYITGSFDGTALFGSTSLVTTVYGGVFFVAKLTATGTAATWAWATTAAGTGTRTASTIGVQGTSIYVGGGFTGSAVFDTNTITELGGGDGFVAKLTDTGTAATWTWAQALGGTVGDDVVAGLVATGGSVYVTGNSKGTNPIFGSTLLAPTGVGAMYVAKLTDAGPTASFTWAQLFGTFNSVNGVSPKTYALGLAAQGTTLYVLGTYNSAVLQLGSVLLPNATLNDSFVLKVTDIGTGGALGWAQAISGAGADIATGITLSGNSLYVTGTFNSPTVSLGSNTLSLMGAYDLFVAKLDDAGATGSWAWAQRAGGTAMAMGTAVSVSSLGTVCVSGSLPVPATFGNLVTTGPAGGNALCLATLSPNTGLPTKAAAPLVGLTVAPNPVSAPLATVQLPAGLAAGPATLTLLDAVGRVVRTHTAILPASPTTTSLNVAGLAPGVYILRIAVSERIGTTRIVIE